MVYFKIRVPTNTGARLSGHALYVQRQASQNLLLKSELVFVSWVMSLPTR